MYNSETWHYINKVIKKFDPKCIILYGSLARTDYNERSDIDLVIISDQFSSINPLERLACLIELNDMLAPIEPLGYTSKEFELMLKKRHATALFTLLEGIPLVGLDFFSQLKTKFAHWVDKNKLRLIESAWIIEE